MLQQVPTSYHILETVPYPSAVTWKTGFGESRSRGCLLADALPIISNRLLRLFLPSYRWLSRVTGTVLILKAIRISKLDDRNKKSVRLTWVAHVPREELGCDEGRHFPLLVGVKLPVARALVIFHHLRQKQKIIFVARRCREEFQKQ